MIHSMITMSPAEPLPSTDALKHAQATATALHAAAKAALQTCVNALSNIWMRCLRAMSRSFGATPLDNHKPTALDNDKPTASTSAAQVGPTDAATIASAIATSISTAAPASESAAHPTAATHSDATATAATADTSDFQTEDHARASNERMAAQDPTPVATSTPDDKLHVPAVVAEYTVAPNDALMIATAQELSSKLEEMGPVPCDTVLKLLGSLYALNNGRAFDALAYPMAIVDIVLAALKAYQYDVGATFKDLSGAWLRTYQGSRLLRRSYERQGDTDAVAQVDAMLLKLTYF